MKHIRLGFTETTLLYYWYLKNIIKININNLILSEQTLINWLFTTSGFYNKKIKGSNFDFKDQYNEIINLPEYNEYMTKIFNIVKNTENIFLCFHKTEYDNYKQQFLNDINVKSYKCLHNIYEHIPNNIRLLIISSFAELIRKQIESGNCQKIFSNFPKLLSIEYYTTPYTFFNNGPDNNNLETADRINKEIELIKDKFNYALISCGSYGCLIAGFIHDILGKDVFMSGGEITYYFGICSKRHPFNEKKCPNPEYWIKEIPEEYKPKDYIKIENGCYW